MSLKKVAEEIRKHVSYEKSVRSAMNTIGIPQDRYLQVLMGIPIEQEHTKYGPLGDIGAVIPDDLEAKLRIVGVHLAEDPRYYSKLRSLGL